MSLREFLMLAKDFDPVKHLIGGWLMSEKLDGQRAFWDGGVTYGMPVKDVPWANTEKDGRLLDPDYKATGLWSRYGRVIHAPDWWINTLPSNILLDGELWCGRGGYQKMRKIVSRLQPDDDQWTDVNFMVFAVPTPHQVFRDGEVRNTNYRKTILYRDVARLFVKWRAGEQPYFGSADPGRVLEQETLPFGPLDAEERLAAKLLEVTAGGGEGLMLRCPATTWEPKRSSFLLKVKKYADSEAKVIGFRWGEEFAKEHGVENRERKAKHFGRMGALRVAWRGKVFDLAGFTDDEREVIGGKNEPGEYDAGGGEPRYFPLNSQVTFTYRELTDDGYPKEAAYLRRKELV